MNSDNYPFIGAHDGGARHHRTFAHRPWFERSPSLTVAAMARSATSYTRWLKERLHLLWPPYVLSYVISYVLNEVMRRRLLRLEECPLCCELGTLVGGGGCGHRCCETCWTGWFRANERECAA